MQEHNSEIKPGKVLIVEPFYTGSHKVLIDLLQTIPTPDGYLPPHLAVMTGKKWHWRARTSALHFAQTIPHEDEFQYRCIFTSSVLPLHELVALRPEFQRTKKILYFHENQLIYPVRKAKYRDFQYGYNQIMSCLVADTILFNSHFNKESFLGNLRSFFKLQPDYRPKNLRETIEPKCKVLYFPVNFENIPRSLASSRRERTPDEPVRIVWPHRWEFDKNPELFFRVLCELIDRGVTNFRLSVLGENFTDNPEVFSNAKASLTDYILHWGFLPSKSDYYQVLTESDIVLSTASHEFFGVAMLEAVYCGCLPLCPKALVYPEVFQGYGDECFYESEDDLLKKLEGILQNPSALRTNNYCIKVDLCRFSWAKLQELYKDELYT